MEKETGKELTGAAGIQAKVARDFHEFEQNFRKRSPIIWLLALIGPLVVTLLILGFIAVTQGWQTSVQIVSNAGLAFFAFGRFVILLGGQTIAHEFSSFNLFLMLTYMDFMTAFFVAFHMGVIFRIPWIGPKVLELVADGQFILSQYPKVRRSAFVGLVLFVIFPTSTTGSIGGSIFGRLLGLTRMTTVIAILIGSIIGNGVMLVFDKQLEQFQWLQQNPWVKIGGVIALVVVFFVFERWYKALRTKFYAELDAKNDAQD